MLTSDKRTFGKFFIYVMPCLVMLSMASASPALANGTVSITSCADFMLIGDDAGHPLSGFYSLTSDLNCSGNGNNVMAGSEVAPFTGDFDGGNHSINVSITIGEANVGLFRATSSARIHDLRLTGSVTANGTVGALIGNDHGSTNVLRISSAATVDSTSGNQAGGLVGNGASTVIHNSFATGAVTGAAWSVGGLVGTGSDLQITDSYATGAISPRDSESTAYYYGGLIGETSGDASGSIADSFSTGAVTTNGAITLYFGGLVGGVTDASTPFTNDFFDAFTSGQANCSGQNNSACTAVNVGGAAPGYFKNDALRAPLNKWNFVDVWEPVSGSTPVFQTSPTPYSAEFWNLASATATPSIPLTAPDLTRNDNEIYFNWGLGSPDPVIHDDSFVARWTKTATFADDTYRFDTVGGDDIRVYVDGALVIDKWLVANSGAANTATRHLTAGPHLIKVEYHENAGVSIAHFSITPASAAAQPTLSVVTPVPASSSTTAPLYFTFSTSEAGALTYAGSCTSTTATAVSGSNTITFTALPVGTYSNCTVSLTGTGTGLDSNVLAVPSFNVAASGGGGGGGGGGGYSSAEQPPSVSVVLPNGGETISGGSAYSVVWSSGGHAPSTFRVSVSMDGGTTWSLLTDTATGNFHAWNVPNVCTTTAKVKVEALDSSYVESVMDESNSNFTIAGNDCTGTLTPASGSYSPPPETGTANGNQNLPVGLEGVDTSSSGPGALPPAEASSKLPPAYTLNSLVKLPDDGNPGTETDTTVYYIGFDAKRHPFINPTAYFSWENSYSPVKFIDAATLASIPLGAPILSRPGTHWVKVTSDPRTYYVEPGYKLRWIKDEATAVKLGGPNWNTRIVDLDTSFFPLYAHAADLDTTALATSWPAGTVIDSSVNIQDDRKLLGLRYYVSGGKKRAFIPATSFDANHFQTRFVWNNATDTDSLSVFQSLPSGPDITALEDALFSLLH